MGPKVRTRKNSGEIGAPSDLPDIGALPTNKDVINALQYEVNKATGQTKTAKENEAIEDVKNSVVNKFKEVNPTLPLIQENSVIRKLNRLYETSCKQKRHQLTAKAFNSFIERLPHLFDIIACQCEIINCGGGQACRSQEDCTGFHILLRRRFQRKRSSM